MKRRKGKNGQWDRKKGKETNTKKRREEGMN